MQYVYQPSAVTNADTYTGPTDQIFTFGSAQSTKAARQA